MERRIRVLVTRSMIMIAPAARHRGQEVVHPLQAQSLTRLEVSARRPRRGPESAVSLVDDGLFRP
jgi:hypothetical protein